MTATMCTMASAYGGHANGRMAAEAAACRAVSRLLRLDDAAVIELASRAGAPRLVRVRQAGSARAVPVTLSIAHSAGAAAAVAAPAGVRVGVDVEPAGSVQMGELRFFLSARERAAALEVGATEMWCLKEAAWKALGCSRAVPFKRVELLFSGTVLSAVRFGGRTWRAVARLRRPTRARRRWVLAAVRLGEELRERSALPAVVWQASQPPRRA
jgi:phosphopantetheinyl transferase